MAFDGKAAEKFFAVCTLVLLFWKGSRCVNPFLILFRNEVAEANENYKAAVSKLTDTKGEQRTSDEDQEKIDPIPVLVFVCNRPRALKQHVDKLLKFVVLFVIAKVLEIFYLLPV